MPFKIKQPQINSDWPWAEMATIDGNKFQCLRTKSVKINFYTSDLTQGEKKVLLKNG